MRGLFIFIFFIIILFLYYYFKLYEIPKYNTIWMYWENLPGKKMPPYINLCIKTVKNKCGKNFKVILLNEKTVYDYLPNLRKDLDEKLNIPQKTDYIRYMLLYTYGGVWVDTDIIVLKDLTPIIKKLRYYDYVGFGCFIKDCRYTGNPRPTNWVMASQKNTQFMDLCLKSCDEKLKNMTNFQYFELGQDNMWPIIDKLQTLGWNYYHYPSNCLERNSKFVRYNSDMMLSNMDIDPVCKDKFLFVPLYHSRLKKMGFPDRDEDEILNSDMLVSKFIRQGLS